ncbi:MAG: cyanophycin synthetase, partial [Candidatus Absconditabacterales bacterium]
YAIQLKNQLKIDYLTYQTEGNDIQADIKFANEKFILADIQGALGVSFDLRIKNKKHHIQTNVLGKPNYGYVGIALAIADIVGRKSFLHTDKLHLGEQLTLEYQLQPGRLSIFPGMEQSIIIDSTYNSSPLSIRKIINTVHNIKTQLFPQRKVRMMLGDMRELGDLTEKEHRMIAGYVSQVADRVFLVGTYMTSYLADELQKVGYPVEKIYTFTKSTEAGDAIKTMLKEPGNECLVICKGSQNTIFLEEAVKKLLANQADEYKLTRQSQRWLKKKESFFRQK